MQFVGARLFKNVNKVMKRVKKPLGLGRCMYRLNREVCFKHSAGYHETRKEMQELVTKKMSTPCFSFQRQLILASNKRTNLLAEVGIDWDRLIYKRLSQLNSGLKMPRLYISLQQLIPSSYSENYGSLSCFKVSLTVI